MRFFERAASTMAALAGIDVSPSFKFGSPDAKLKGQGQRAAPLAAGGDTILPIFQQLTGNYAGIGFNSIFRPNSLGSGGTTFPNAVSSTDTLMLNLMSETLNINSGIGDIPNRGLDPQPDIFLSALPYVQAINDVTNPQTGKPDGSPIGIHFEPGLFVHVPSTDKNPVIGATLNRLASIPHGTTINAQAIEPLQAFQGGPQFSRVNITPFKISDGTPVPFLSQTANNTNTARLPQDLTNFIRTGTITQAILDDPNTVLRQAIVGQNITSTVVFTVATQPQAPITGGGTANNAFLTGGGSGSGAAASGGPNANAVQMNATFWIETVSWTITVPVSKSGQTMTLTPVAPNANVTLPQFSVTPPKDINKPVNVTGQTTQIQYSQMVILNFNGLSWPHASVNTLTQQGAVSVPASAFN